MEDRAVPVWRLQTAKIKTSSLFCICEEQLEVKGDVGPEAAHRISRGAIRRQPAMSILHKTSSGEINSLSAPYAQQHLLMNAIIKIISNPHLQKNKNSFIQYSLCDELA